MLPLFLLASIIAGPEHSVAPVTYGPSITIQNELAVATDGSDFEVLWTDGYGLYASHVSGAGDVAFEHQVRLLRGSGRSAMYWNGSAYVVLTKDRDTLLEAELSRGGDIVIAPHVVATGVGLDSVAWNGRHAFVMYDAAASLPRALILDRYGTVVRSDITLPYFFADFVRSVRVVTDGDRFTVFWYATHFGPPLIRYARYTDAGDFIDSPDQPLIEGSMLTDVAYAAGKYAIIDEKSVETLQRFIVDGSTMKVSSLPEMPNVSGARLTTDGRRFIVYGGNGQFAAFTGDPETSAPTYTDTRAGSGPAAWNGSRFLIAWHSGAIFGNLVEPSLVASNDFLISRGPRDQRRIGVARNGSQSLALFVEQTSTTPYAADLRAVRIAADGTALDAEPVTIERNGWSASVVPAPSGYFAFWPSNGVIHGRHIGFDGSMSADRIYGNGASVGAVANRSMILLVLNGTSAIRLTSAGDPIDSIPFAIPGPAVATNGTDFLLMWREGSDLGPITKPPSILAARLLANGTVDAVPFVVASGQPTPGSFSVASDGRDYLVVYSRGASAIYAKRVLAEGQLADTTADAPGTLLAAARSASPFIAAEGAGYLVGWENMNTAAHEIRLMRVSSIGGPLSEPTVVATSTSVGGYVLDMAAKLAVASGLSPLLVYARMIDDPRRPSVNHVFAKTLVEPAHGRTVRH